MNSSERIIVALDTDVRRARELAGLLKDQAKWLKVGMTLFYSEGPAIVRELKEQGFKVFVDLKLHDIPHQVRGAAQAVAQAGADMLTVHAAGGAAMMSAALEGAAEGYQQGALQQGAAHTQEDKRPLCLAITVLTSLDDEVLASIGVNAHAGAQVARLAALAEEAGMDGIVCSPEETALVRRQAHEGFVLVTPGVRPVGSAKGDQARVATPPDALNVGADYLVIGRPITEASDPSLAFTNIVQSIEQ